MAFPLAGLVVAGAAAAPALAANARPDANFGVFPRNPVSGQMVRLVSYACDPDGKVAEQAWDLDNDGVYNDAFGANATRSFGPGPHRVRLRATDRSGLEAIRTRIVDVEPGSPDYVIPRPFDPPLLSPFPIVRLNGQVIAAGTRIRVLSVQAPVCSRATVLCGGPTCPWRRATKKMGRRPTRFPKLRHVLAPGTRLVVLVSKRDRVGKYTRFEIRRNRTPKRRDLCLAFGTRRGIPCRPD